MQWGMAISGEELQKEMNRIARSTRKPEVLQEIFNEFNNDGHLIVECLARPVLVERQMRASYEKDANIAEKDSFDE